MDKNLSTILKEMKRIQPNAEYSKYSRDLILLSPKIHQPKLSYIGALNWIKLHRISTTAVSFGILMVSAFIIVSYLPGNKNGLVAEANEINSSIQIQLDEIKYQLNNQLISTSTAENTQNKLNEATKNLLTAFEISSDSKKIEEAIKNIKEAQDIIAKLDSQLRENK